MRGKLGDTTVPDRRPCLRFAATASFAPPWTRGAERGEVDRMRGELGDPTVPDGRPCLRVAAAALFAPPWTRGVER